MQDILGIYIDAVTDPKLQKASKIKSAEKLFERLNANIIPGITGIIKGIAEVDTSKVDDVKIGIFNKIGGVISKFNSPVDSKNVETQKKMLDNISKFINKANSIDVDKIKSTTDMFQ